MEFQSPESTGHKINPDIVPKIKSRQVVTIVINRERLRSYYDAALATGFKVEQIADEGEEFPYLCVNVNKDGIIKQEYGSGETLKVAKSKVTEKGHIAVSIEVPAGSDPSKGHNPFWNNLNTESWKQ